VPSPQDMQMHALFFSLPLYTFLLGRMRGKVGSPKTGHEHFTSSHTSLAIGTKSRTSLSMNSPPAAAILVSSPAQCQPMASVFSNVGWRQRACGSARLSWLWSESSGRGVGAPHIIVRGMR
jgi:hypothetical protein